MCISGQKGFIKYPIRRSPPRPAGSAKYTHPAQRNHTDLLDPHCPCADIRGWSLIYITHFLPSSSHLSEVEPSRLPLPHLQRTLLLHSRDYNVRGRSHSLVHNIRRPPPA